jgi:ATP-binding cassette subfamily C (CFTR/MRP) protein 4
MNIQTLKLRTLGDASAGQIVNLVSNDVSRFEMVVFMLHYLWSAPIQTVVIGYFVYQEVGLAGVAGLAVICTVAPIQCKLNAILNISNKFVSYV